MTILCTGCGKPCDALDGRPFECALCGERLVPGHMGSPVFTRADVPALLGAAGVCSFCASSTIALKGATYRHQQRVECALAVADLDALMARALSFEQISADVQELARDVVLARLDAHARAYLDGEGADAGLADRLHTRLTELCGVVIKEINARLEPEIGVRVSRLRLPRHEASLARLDAEAPVSPCPACAFRIPYTGAQSRCPSCDTLLKWCPDCKKYSLLSQRKCVYCPKAIYL